MRLLNAYIGVDIQNAHKYKLKLFFNKYLDRYCTAAMASAQACGRLSSGKELNPVNASGSLLVQTAAHSLVRPPRPRRPPWEVEEGSAGAVCAEGAQLAPRTFRHAKHGTLH